MLLKRARALGRRTSSCSRSSCTRSSSTSSRWLPKSCRRRTTSWRRRPFKPSRFRRRRRWSNRIASSKPPRFRPHATVPPIHPVQVAPVPFPPQPAVESTAAASVISLDRTIEEQPVSQAPAAIPDRRSGARHRGQGDHVDHDHAGRIGARRPRGQRATARHVRNPPPCALCRPGATVPRTSPARTSSCTWTSNSGIRSRAPVRV